MQKTLDGRKRKLSMDAASLRMQRRRLSATGASALSLSGGDARAAAARLRARRASLASGMDLKRFQAEGLKSAPGPAVTSKRKTHAQKRDEVKMAMIVPPSKGEEWVQKRDAKSGKAYWARITRSIAHFIWDRLLTDRLLTRFYSYTSQANLVTRETTWTNPTTGSKRKTSKKKKNRARAML